MGNLDVFENDVLEFTGKIIVLNKFVDNLFLLLFVQMDVIHVHQAEVP